jgi:hypothetical protein
MTSTSEATVLEIAKLICVTTMTVFVIGCVTYSCTSPDQVDQEAQAIRTTEARKMEACVRTGGSWMPIREAYHAGGRGYSSYYTSVMSCVTDKTLPLAIKMNL